MHRADALAATPSPRPFTVASPAGAGLAVGYVALYLLLDRVSLIQPFAFGITPWNPPAGLCFAALLRYGYRFAPITVLAVALGEVMFRGLPALGAETAAAALIIAFGYAAAAAVARDRLRVSLRLERHRDLLWLLGVAAPATLLVAAAVVATLALAGRVPIDGLLLAGLHFWIGDLIGIAVLTPFLLLLGDRPTRGEARGRLDVREAPAQLVAIGLGLWTVFGLERGNHFEYAYVLFLPLIWIAMRGGLMATTWGIVATQFGLILAVQAKGLDAAAVTQFQLLMMAVAVTGLVLGSVVEEGRRAETLLRDSEARLQAVLRTAPDAVLTFAESGAVLSANPAAARMFGRAQGDWANAALGDLLPGLVPVEGGVPTGREIVAARADGTPLVVEAAIGTALIDGGKVYVAVVRDVSARKEAEARLKAHESDLVHAARLATTGEMAAALAHELNQPLTALIGFARACQAALRAGAGSPADRQAEAAALIDKAVDQAVRAGEIMRTTREFLSHGDMQRAPTEPARIVATALDMVRPIALRQRIAVESAVEDGLPPVFVDPIQIEQVILNLVRNSLEEIARADPPVRRIVVGARLAPDEPGFVEIAVRDSGPGFAPEIAGRLFKPFATTKAAGTGLGLSISRSIVESHGGRIWVATDGSWRGADVRFTIPVDSEPGNGS